MTKFKETYCLIPGLQNLLFHGIANSRRVNLSNKCSSDNKTNSFHKVSWEISIINRLLTNALTIFLVSNLSNLSNNFPNNHNKAHLASHYNRIKIRRINKCLNNKVFQECNNSKWQKQIIKWDNNNHIKTVFLDDWLHWKLF